MTGVLTDEVIVKLEEEEEEEEEKKEEEKEGVRGQDAMTALSSPVSTVSVVAAQVWSRAVALWPVKRVNRQACCTWWTEATPVLSAGQVAIGEGEVKV
ncbi:hypothetical protein E2C01_081278 [Portunus trituberculatus]|uniref:Uncharacterized protein n=1 Tax=Portunus trituberculatus TaxID=210409 RepID=A0A5B7IW79_PORTR|nr:hypothetical protein [Portunus trituberculatus]